MQLDEQAALPAPTEANSKLLLPEEKVCAALLALMVGLMFAQATVRNLAPLGRTAFATWLAHATEVLPSGLTWLTFLGCSAVTRRHDLLSIDVVRRRLTPRLQRTLAAVIWILWAAFFSCLVVLGARAAYEQGGQMTSIAWLPAWAVSLSVPVGAALVVWRTAQNLRDLAGRGTGSTAQEGTPE